ncbi:MAG: hypothetical protein ACM30I_10865 [Gemmatimonas sp.]
MRKWLVTYEDDPQRAVEVLQGPLSDQRIDFLFDGAAATGVIEGRIVHGMWLLDVSLDHEEVVGVYGWYPPSIRDRITARTRCPRKARTLRPQ